MHTVELLLDTALEEHIRGLWERLHAAGLPSLATHQGSTNRPHVTLAVVASTAGLPGWGLPFAAELGGARMLGRALVRDVVRTPGLIALHQHLWESVGSTNPLHDPATWTPHVSLALRMPPERAAAALEILGELPPAHGRFTGARSYDMEARTVTTLSPPTGGLRA